MLPSSNRLLRKDIPFVMKTGLRIRGVCMEIIYLANKSDTRFAVIVSTKIEKRATQRNRMKRLVHEALRDLLPHMKKGLYAIVLIRSRLPDSKKEVHALLYTTLVTHRIVKSSTL